MNSIIPPIYTSVLFIDFLHDIMQEKDPEAKPLLLHRDVKVRWNSTYIMMERELLVYFPIYLSAIPRMLYLKDRGLLEVLAMPEWSSKVLDKLRPGDWTVMANIVTTLKVR